MSDIIFEGVQDLYIKIEGKEVDPTKHGALAIFHIRMKAFNDPKTCSCKKGKGASDNILKSYMTMPSALRIEPYRSAVKELLGEGTLVFKINGIEFARVV